MKRTQKYWNELAGYLSGEMSEKERSSFLPDKESNHQLKNDIELMKHAWNDFTPNPENKYMETGKAWDLLNSRLEKDGLLENQVSPTSSFDMSYVIRIAAIILLVLAVAVPALYYSINNAGNGSGIIEYNSSEGIKTVDLPDGSRVFLNEGSTLRFDNDYEVERDVKLEGEGYFDVMSDPERPFRVNTGKVVVTVLGTSFNVKNAADEVVEVYVESGKVRMNLDNQQSVTLGPGQLGQANGLLKTSGMEDANYISWKTKDFKFVDQPVDKILDVLEQAYHVDVNTDQVAVSNMRLTTSYSQQSIDAILNTICTALNMQYQKEGKVYILQTK